MKLPISHQSDLTIWSHFIRAQSSLISKLCAPIHLLPTHEKINSQGLIKLEINQEFDGNAVLDLIKRYFPKIKGEDILLDKGYFLLDNNMVPRLENLEKFREEVEKYYILFDTHPTIEGVLSDMSSPMSELTELLNANQVEVQFNKDGELLLSQKGIDLFDQQKRVQREKKIGAIYPVKISYDKLIANEIEGLLNRLNIQKEDYKIVTYDSKIYSDKALFTSEGFGKLNDVIGLTMQTCIVQFWVNQDKFKGNWEECHLKDEILPDNNGNYFYEFRSSKNQLMFDGEQVTFDEYLTMSYFSLQRFYGQDGIEKIEKRYVFEYDPTSPYFDKINNLELNDGTWGKIKDKLDLNIFWCNSLLNTISFDFTSKNDFVTKYEQLKAIEWLDVSSYKDEHKFKITPIIPNRFEDIKKQLSTKFKKIQFKDVNGGEKLIIRYGYKLSEDEGDARLRFLNELNKYKNQGFDFLMDGQFKVKFIFEVNEELKEFEQNTKFNKIRGSEIKLNDEVIGTLRKAKFPILELQVKAERIAEFNEKLSVDAFFLSEIKPELAGELEKIKRLENAIDKLASNGKGLPNPNIVNFIFDSSKAKANENITIYEETSEEWTELERTKLSSNINKSQLKAVLTTLYAQDLAIVQGPPGTGKSTAISEIIWQHIRKNPKQKILLTSETHLAVDNALDKLATPINNLVKPIRLGKEENLEEEGARFSLTRIQNWVENNQIDNSVNENGVVKWIGNIARKSKSSDKYEEVSHFIDIWQKVLTEPDKKIRKYFADSYLDYANILGATCSSIAKFSTPKKIMNKKGEEVEVNPWTPFFYTYLNVFFREKYQQYQLAYGYEKITTKENCDKESINFDVVIMDEASKATPAEFALPLLFGKKSIVVGDHRQLPPMLDENDFATTLEMIGERQLAREFRKQDHNISHFEKLFLNPNVSDTIRASFDTQYRMHPQINEVIKQFYIKDKGLECGLDPSQVDDPNLNNPESRYHGFKLEGFVEPQTHVIWIDVDTPEVLEGTSRVNFGEIEACQTVLNCLINANGFDEFQNHWQNNPKAKPEESEIGLISFYGRQLHYLEQVKRDFANQITIRSNTVDKFQGMERNIIIVSMVRSNKLAGSKNQEPDFDTYPELGYTKQDALGFAEFPNRLNVALSRAKRLLIIVGNSAHFCKHEVYKNVYDTINKSPFDKIIDYKTLKNNTLAQTI